MDHAQSHRAIEPPQPQHIPRFLTASCGSTPVVCRAITGTSANTPTVPTQRSFQKTLEPPSTDCQLRGSLNFTAWERLLPTDYPERAFILTGITEGFRIISKPYTGPDILVPNHKSALDHRYRDLVEAQIIEELDNERYIIIPRPAPITSALGAIPKDNGKIRLIHDCSRLEGSAVNDLVRHQTFSYQTTADAMALMSQGCWLGKIDLQSAYRSCGTHPADFYQVAGLSWRFSGHKSDSYLVDACLMYGSSMAPFTFHTLTTAVCHIMQINGHPAVTAYLDDFLVQGTTYYQCLGSMNTLLSLPRHLGFSINYDKLIAPSQSVVLLGVQFQTVPFVASLPKEKLDRFLDLIRSVLNRASVTMKMLQQTAGKLVWAARLIKLGRAHLRRLLTFMNTLKHQSQRTRLNEDTRRDLVWWLTFANHLNGHFPISDSRPCAPLCIDACTTGGGGFFQGQGFYISWQDWPEAESLHINFKEVLVLEPAAHLWAPLWAHKVIFVHCDNQCAVSIINKGSSRNETVMDSLRRIAWLATKWNFDLRAIYYSGSQNILADSLSRLPKLAAINTLNAMLGQCFLKHCIRCPPLETS